MMIYTAYWGMGGARMIYPERGAERTPTCWNVERSTLQTKPKGYKH